MAIELDTLLTDFTSGEAIIEAAIFAESHGFGTVWSSEAGHDPYVQLALSAGVTRRVGLGTAIAVAYGRTPYSTAQAAWDMQKISGGRMRLGLATQVKPHIERRYGTTWPGGVGAMREYVECCRAIWSCWQTGARPEFEGKHYRYTLSNPEFEPGPLPDEQAEVPVWLAGVTTLSARLAGEIADGFVVHAFHTENYLRGTLFEAVREARVGTGRKPMLATCPVFAGVARDEREAAQVRDEFRPHIAFYGSTKGYLDVMRSAGAEDLHPQLKTLAREQRWSEMTGLIDDELLDQFVVVDEPKKLGERLAGRYGGLLSSLSLYRGGERFVREGDWELLMAGLRSC